MSQKWSSHRLSEQSAHAWKSEEGGSVAVQVIALRAKLDHAHLLENAVRHMYDRVRKVVAASGGLFTE